jgi:uncharacterized membrane protein
MTVLKNTLKAAAVALAMAGTAMSVSPAQAQPRPNVDFNFSFGSGGSGIQFGIGNPGRACMTDPQVRRDLRSDGYREIRFFDRRGRIVQVRAELGRNDYRIAYDTCRGRIIDRDRIRR